MPFSSTHDREKLRQAANDESRNVPEMLQQRLLNDIRPSFDEAYRRMSAERKPGLFALKSGSVALGGVMMVDGMYHLIGGNDERVEDLFLHTHNDRNYVRMFTGAFELGTGAMLAYLGAVKGPHGPKL